MKLDILYFLVIGYFAEVSGDGHHSKHVKIIVPQYFHKHNHKHVVYKKVPVHEKEKKHFVIHKHDHNHKHKHDHGHKHGHDHKHKHGHKHKGHHDHKHKHDHHHHKKHGHHGHHDHYGWYGYQPYKAQKSHEDFSINPVDFDDDGYHTSKKSVRSEHFEVETINPDAEFPDEKHQVRGSYKVEETDPHDFTTTSYHTYDSPVTKEIAQALTNFGGKYDHLYPYKETADTPGYKVKEEEETERQKEDTTDEENVAEYDDELPPYKQYEDYGDSIEQSKEYRVDPYIKKVTVPEDSYDSYTGQYLAEDRSYNPYARKVAEKDDFDPYLGPSYVDEPIERYIHKKIYG